MKRCLYILLFALLLVAACSDSTSPNNSTAEWVRPDGYNFPIYLGNYNRITVTDTNGSITSDPDSLDWRLYPAPANAGRPVEVQEFYAVYQPSFGQVFISWITASETNLVGFNILRGTTNNAQQATVINLQLVPPTNTSATHTYTYSDINYAANTQYYYWLQVVEGDATTLNVGPQSVYTGTNPEGINALYPAYPNPGTSFTVNLSVQNGYTAYALLVNNSGQVIKDWGEITGQEQSLEADFVQMQVPAGLYRVYCWFTNSENSYYAYGDVQYAVIR